MISGQTLRVCPEGKPLHTFPDHALDAEFGYHAARISMHLALRAAHEPAGSRAGGGPAALRDHARDNGGVEAVNLLQEATAADRKVVVDLRRMQMEAIVVDHIDVGLVAGGDDAAIREADRQG